jgi:hypothetical protein
LTVDEPKTLGEGGVKENFEGGGGVIKFFKKIVTNF